MNKEYIAKIDRRGKVKRNQDKSSALTIGGHGAGNHSDMDLICVASRGREERCLTPRRTAYGKQIRKQYEAGEITVQRKYIQRLEPRTDGMANCLTTVPKDNLLLQRIGGASFRDGEIRPHQGDSRKSGLSELGTIVPDEGKASCLTTSHQPYFYSPPPLRVPENTKKGYCEVQPGDCVDLTNILSKTRRGRSMKDKFNCLMTTQQLCRLEAPHQLNPAPEFGSQPRQQNRVYSPDATSPAVARPPAGVPRIPAETYRIRRLTPTECARLQTIPDWYEWRGKFDDGSVKETSDTQRYKMLGNGWCVEVIKHLLSFLPIE